MNSITKKCTKCGVEKQLSEFKKWSAQCKKCEYLRIAEWKRNNKDKVKKWARGDRKGDKIYRETHKEQYREYRQAWNKTLIGKIAKKLDKYRRRGAVGKFTKSEWQDLCDRYGNRCLSCGEQKELTVDHVVSLKDGGSNTIDNLQPLCLSCNSRKGAKFIDYR